MKTFNALLAVGTISLILAATTTVVEAQIQLVHLSVTKVQKYDQKGAPTGSYSTGSYGWGSSMSAHSEVKSGHYTISIQNAGNKALKSLRVEWKTLAQTADKKLSVAQGEKTMDVEMGKTYEFDTDSADGKVLGYSIQVFSEDKVLASAAEPADIKAQIDKAGGSSAK